MGLYGDATLREIPSLPFWERGSISDLIFRYRIKKLVGRKNQSSDEGFPILTQRFHPYLVIFVQNSCK